MHALIQRVLKASISVPETQYYQEIDSGLLVFLGIKDSDTKEDTEYVAEKCANLRIFSDSNDKMNLSVIDVGGSVLVISQFTLYGDTRKGNRPSFIEAARPEEAILLYNHFLDSMSKKLGESKIKSGVFGAMMQVSLINDGPVTISVYSK